jgi:putative transposase
MAPKSGTFSKIYIQIIFAVKYREAVIDESWEEDLYKYITGIVKNKGQLMIAINGCYDHIHILISIRPTCNLSDLVREIKKASNEFINGSCFVRGKFSWQDGFGAFSCSHWDKDTIVNYIRRQKEHHGKKSFRDEYLQLLKDHDIDYKEEFLFKVIDAYEKGEPDVHSCRDL